MPLSELYNRVTAVYEIATRALAEPADAGNDTAALIQICTVLEKGIPDKQQIKKELNGCSWVVGALIKLVFNETHCRILLGILNGKSPLPGSPVEN